MNKSTSTLLRAIGATVLLVGLSAAPAASGHEGHEHGAEEESLKGTVESVGGDKLTVHTADGKSVSVHVDARTRFENDGHGGNISELSPGMRVVVNGQPMNDGTVHAAVVRYVAKGSPSKHS